MSRWNAPLSIPSTCDAASDTLSATPTNTRGRDRCAERNAACGVPGVNLPAGGPLWPWPLSPAPRLRQRRRRSDVRSPPGTPSLQSTLAHPCRAQLASPHCEESVLRKPIGGNGRPRPSATRCGISHSEFQASTSSFAAARRGARPRRGHYLRKQQQRHGSLDRAQAFDVSFVEDEKLGCLVSGVAFPDDELSVLVHLPAQAAQC